MCSLMIFLQKIETKGASLILLLILDLCSRILFYCSWGTSGAVELTQALCGPHYPLAVGKMYKFHRAKPMRVLESFNFLGTYSAPVHQILCGSDT